MDVLFIHQNFPGQYKLLAEDLARDRRNRVVFLTQGPMAPLGAVQVMLYRPDRPVGAATHHYIRELEAGVLNGQAVARACVALEASGFRPDIVIGHNGWGEILYVKDVWPRVPLLGYFEFFYRLHGSDVAFDPEFPPNPDDGPRLRTRNSINLLGLDAADWGQTPTAWQRDQYPSWARGRLSVVHEGVDTALVRPDPEMRLQVGPGGPVLGTEDEVVTYVARNLEPYRGFHSFMRAVPEIQRRRPNVHVVVVGGDDVSYGPRPPAGTTFRQALLRELGDRVDLGRLHFLAPVPYDELLSLLQVSSAHVYLTYPFVLSWSFLEAMAAGCLMVASRTPPVEEVIADGVNGRLVNFFAPGEIAATVADSLAGRAALGDLRAAARRTAVERYDFATVSRPAQLRLIDALLGGRTPESAP